MKTYDSFAETPAAPPIAAVASANKLVKQLSKVSQTKEINLEIQIVGSDLMETPLDQVGVTALKSQLKLKKIF